MSTAQEKTELEYWDRVWEADPLRALPSRFDVGSRNLQRLLRRFVSPSTRYLEIGCAPGRLLAWVALRLGAQVAGLDYSPAGIDAARRIFERLGLAADLRCEDVFGTTFVPGAFDVVASFGLIEHFDDPRPVVERHVDLLGPGGTALIVIPHYSGIYGWLQRRFYPENLTIHNLAIMRPDRLLELVPSLPFLKARSYAAGRIAPGLVNFEKRWSRVVAKTAERSLALAGCAQPFDIPGLCPLLVLQITRMAQSGT